MGMPPEGSLFRATGLCEAVGVQSNLAEMVQDNELFKKSLRVINISGSSLFLQRAGSTAFGQSLWRGCQRKYLKSFLMASNQTVSSMIWRKRRYLRRTKPEQIRHVTSLTL